MKKISLFLAALVLSACAQFGVPTPQTLSQQIAVTVTTVSGVRENAAMLLQTKRISVEDAENIQKQADAVVAGATIARSLAVTDPASAQTKLQQTRAVLLALQQYLLAKEAGK
jgi:hypothetical protein